MKPVVALGETEASLPSPAKTGAKALWPGEGRVGPLESCGRSLLLSACRRFFRACHRAPSASGSAETRTMPSLRRSTEAVFNLSSSLLEVVESHYQGGFRVNQLLVVSP